MFGSYHEEAGRGYAYVLLAVSCYKQLKQKSFWG
jgi:hypothetical protein